MLEKRSAPPSVPAIQEAIARLDREIHAVEVWAKTLRALTQTEEKPAPQRKPRRFKVRSKVVQKVRPASRADLRS